MYNWWVFCLLAGSNDNEERCYEYPGEGVGVGVTKMREGSQRIEGVVMRRE